jgi:nucleotide-binding universal stress UspA family protein
MKILIATDGSKYGQAAVDFAANFISQPDTTEVKIVSVIEPFALNEIETLIEETDELASLTNAAARQAEMLGKRLAGDFSEKFPGTKIQVSNEVLGGPAARTIIEKAEEWNADLIVTGSHGKGFWQRAWLGSVSDRVAHHAPCSVLIVRVKKE